MGSYLIKVSREVDLYLEWSSIVEAPTFVGTRVEVAVRLAQDPYHRVSAAERTPEVIEARLARTDAHGCSLVGFQTTWDDGEIFEQRGVLPRRNFEAFARIYIEAGDEPFTDEQWNRLCDLLEPFEDDFEDDKLAQVWRTR